MSKRSSGAFVAALVLLISCSGGDRTELDAEIGSPLELAFIDENPAVAESGDVATEAGDDETEGRTTATPLRVDPDGDRPSGFWVNGDGIVVPTELGDGLTSGDDPALDALWTACDAGDDRACDELFFSSPVGSGYEAFAGLCGGRRTSTSGGCHVGSEPGPVTSTPPGRAGDVYGDNPGFDALWDACDAGIHDACDDLWGMSPLDSGYEAFASTCGYSTVATDGGCSERLGGAAGDDFFAQHYGGDPGLDVVHDACRAGGGAACDLLYDMSPIDSDYERLALTCGDRRALAFIACA